MSTKEETIERINANLDMRAATYATDVQRIFIATSRELEEYAKSVARGRMPSSSVASMFAKQFADLSARIGAFEEAEAIKKLI
jgi:hypothetical protein